MLDEIKAAERYMDMIIEFRFYWKFTASGTSYKTS